MQAIAAHHGPQPSRLRHDRTRVPARAVPVREHRPALDLDRSLDHEAIIAVSAASVVAGRSGRGRGSWLDELDRAGGEPGR
jgi:hypothetical protein